MAQLFILPPLYGDFKCAQDFWNTLYLILCRNLKEEQRISMALCDAIPARN